MNGAISPDIARKIIEYEGHLRSAELRNGKSGWSQYSWEKTWHEMYMKECEDAYEKMGMKESKERKM